MTEGEELLLDDLKLFGRVEVPSLRDAVKLAKRAKDNNMFDLFRGQTDASRRLLPTALRCSEAQRKDAVECFKRLVSWAQCRPEMTSFAKDTDSLLAVAQHYGLKTNFLDFTSDPDVAGFFACDTQRDIPKGQKAVIFCLDSKVFEDFWHRGIGKTILSNQSITKDAVEIVRIDVGDLWRLQSQSGCFLWTALPQLSDYELCCGIARIEFPWTSSDPCLPSREKIYPSNKSALEQLLDRFFFNERAIKWNNESAKYFPDQITLAGSNDLISWWPPGVELDDEWNSIGHEWFIRPQQHVEVALPGIELVIDDLTSMDSICDDLKNKINASFIELHRNQCLRLRTHSGWALDYDEVDSREREWIFWLALCVSRHWDGIRRYPYTASEIHHSLAVTLSLFSQKAATPGFQPFGDEMLRVDLSANANGKGDYSRGYVSRSRFEAALNPAFRDAVEAYSALPNRISTSTLFEFQEFPMLEMPGRPRERFRWAGLRDLMVYELIPSQIVWRGHGDGKSLPVLPILFSPAELSILGPASS